MNVNQRESETADPVIEAIVGAANEIGNVLGAGVMPRRKSGHLFFGLGEPVRPEKESFIPTRNPGIFHIARGASAMFGLPGPPLPRCPPSSRCR